MMDKNDKNKKQNENEKVEDKEVKKDPSADSTSSQQANSRQGEAVLLKEKIEELENQVKRTLADYRNLENRIQSERGEWILKANKQLLLNILPVLDTLILAAKHSKDQSLALSLAQFLDVLKKEGVVRIEALGKSFDPNSMEGIGAVEGEEGKVINETRPGYMLYDKVLRPAQVQVGKGK